MEAFAERTGLSPPGRPRRYLWTDAFAVINFLELHRRTNDERFKTLALDLIAQVHSVLGRHREDDPRSGWLSGLSAEAGAAHPTRGGLRIGKPLPERRPGEAFDERLEWERDGQYFHYLTKWMDALSKAGLLLDESDCLLQAGELAKAVFPRFLRTTSSGVALGLAWKMSVDLSRPQVASMSPHDALDGYVTYKWLGAATGNRQSLGAETGTLQDLADGRRWDTSDPLGLGGLLFDALRLAVLPGRSNTDERIIGRILSGVAAGLGQFLRQAPLDQPPDRRLGFRELGLSIGLQGLESISSAAASSPKLAAETHSYMPFLMEASAIGPRIIEFWSEPRNRQHASWQDHRDINEVMLASAMLRAQVATTMTVEWH